MDFRKSHNDSQPSETKPGKVKPTITSDIAVSFNGIHSGNNLAQTYKIKRIDINVQLNKLKIVYKAQGLQNQKQNLVCNRGALTLSIHKR